MTYFDKQAKAAKSRKSTHGAAFKAILKTINECASRKIENPYEHLLRVLERDATTDTRYLRFEIVNGLKPWLEGRSFAQIEEEIKKQIILDIDNGIITSER